MSDRESECALPDGARPLPASFGVSFDLIVFDAVEPLTPESIQQRFSEAEARFAVGDAEFPEANPATPRLQAFLTDLEARWPDLDSPRASWKDSPWASGFFVDDGSIVLNIQWPRAQEVARYVSELTERHGLQLFDPQTERVVLPSRLGGSGQAPWDVDDPMPGVISAMESYQGDPNDVEALSRHVDAQTGGSIRVEQRGVPQRLKDRLRRLLN